MSPPEVTIKIDSLAYGPYGIGRHGGKVIMVPLTVPGDEAEVRIVEERKNYAVGQLSRLSSPSPQRRTPPCPYFGRCGGCPWQQVDYELQLAAKEKSVVDALCRIGRLDGFQTLPILASPQDYHYRRRIRLESDGGKRIGFHPILSRELVEIDSCLIADPEVDRHIEAAREWIGKLATQIGHVEIVAGDREKQAVLIGRAEGRFSRSDDARCAHWLAGHEDISGLVLWGPSWRRSWGNGKISLSSHGDTMVDVDAEVFTQVNRGGNRRLVEETLRWGGFHARDRVLDLYCGAGNLTLPLAQRAMEVTAVEGDRLSVDNGKTNGRHSRIENIRWICSDVSHAARGLVRKGERFSKIVLNPPRSGAKGLERDLASLGAEKILYVSCNPPTLARDLSALDKKGYRLTRVQPIDLFPHTYHVEALAEMARL